MVRRPEALHNTVGRRASARGVPRCKLPRWGFELCSRWPVAAATSARSPVLLALQHLVFFGAIGVRDEIVNSPAWVRSPRSVLIFAGAGRARQMGIGASSGAPPIRRVATFRDRHAAVPIKK